MYLGQGISASRKAKPPSIKRVALGCITLTVDKKTTERYYYDILSKNKSQELSIVLIII
jgi:hypothetical protein